MAKFTLCGFCGKENCHSTHADEVVLERAMVAADRLTFNGDTKVDLEKVKRTARRVRDKANETIDALEKATNGNSQETKHVRLADVVKDLRHIMEAYIEFPKDGLSTLIVFWVVLTYSFHLFRYAAYLRVTSATVSCGKSLLLDMLHLVVAGKPPVECEPSPAVLFRTGEQPCLLDEIDKLRAKDKETAGAIMAVLNAGFKKGSVVRRCVGKNHEVKTFPVYSPKAYAGLESVDETVASRSFVIVLKKALRKVARPDERILEPKAEAVSANITAWVHRNESKILATYERFECESLRAYPYRYQDIAEPLVTLAVLADAECHDTEGGLFKDLIIGLDAARGEKRQSGREANFLVFLGLVKEWLKGQTEVFINSSDLVDKLADIDELSWIDGPRRLSNFLGNFELFKGRDPITKHRGYTITRQWLEEYTARYLNQGGTNEP